MNTLTEKFAQHTGSDLEKFTQLVVNETVSWISDNVTYIDYHTHNKLNTHFNLPPPGYTAEELHQDNPYNQWMHE